MRRGRVESTAGIESCRAMPLVVGIVACLYLATAAAAAAAVVTGGELLPPPPPPHAESEAAVFVLDMSGDEYESSSSISSSSTRGSTSGTTTPMTANTWSLSDCAKHAVCYKPDQPCGRYEIYYNDLGTCVCQYPLPADYKCFGNSMAAIEEMLGCDWGICSKIREPYDSTDSWSTAMPLALATGTCFIVAATAMIACKMLIRRMNGTMATRRGDGDTESVNSMQRWINERLRDRPPRYEEMASASVSASAEATPALGLATISAAVLETEKPPPYEVAASGTQTTSFYCQPALDGSPPPPYSAEDVGDCRQGFTNPCFVGDGEDPPPYMSASASASTSAPTTAAASATLSSSATSSSLATLLSLSPSTDSSTAMSSLSSDCSSTPMSSLSSTSSSSSPFFSTSSSLRSSSDAPPADLLTVSQAVALRDMVLAEGLGGGDGGCDAAVAEVHGRSWTSSSF